MDVAAASIMLNQSQLQTQAVIQVLLKAMNVSEIQSQGIIQMLEHSVQPHLGGNIDIKIQDKVYNVKILDIMCSLSQRAFSAF